MTNSPARAARPPSPRARPIDCGMRREGGPGRIAVIVTLSKIKLHPQYRPYDPRIGSTLPLNFPRRFIADYEDSVRSKFGASNRAFEESMTEVN